MKKFKLAFVSLILIAAMLASGTSLLAFANKNEPWVLFGDVNQDGFVTAVDARQALRQAGRLDKALEPSSLSFLAADIDKDDKITAVDARTILRHTAALEIINQPPNPNAVDNQTPDTILDKIRDLGNEVKDVGIGFTRKEKGEVLSVNAKFNDPVRQFFLGSMLNELKEGMMEEPYETASVKINGSRAKNFFPSEGEEWSVDPNFTIDMLKIADAVEDRDNQTFIYTVMLKDEKFSNIHNLSPDTEIKTKHGMIFANHDIQEMGSAFSFEDEYITVKEASMTFKDSYVRYVFSSITGDLISAEYHLRWNIYVVMNMQVIGDLTVEVLTSTTQTFTDFVRPETND